MLVRTDAAVHRSTHDGASHPLSSNPLPQSPLPSTTTQRPSYSLGSTKPWANATRPVCGWKGPRPSPRRHSTPTYSRGAFSLSPSTGRKKRLVPALYPTHNPFPTPSFTPAPPSLESAWRFLPGPDDGPRGSAHVDFTVRFQVGNPVARAAVDLVFRDVAAEQMRAFERRCREVYGGGGGGGARRPLSQPP